MKLRKMIYILVLVLALVGCGSKKEQDENQDTSESDDIVINTENQDEYAGIYDELLDTIYNLMVSSPEDMLDIDGMGGIYEAIRDVPISEALSNVGYNIQDISGDGIPELMVGNVTGGSDGKSYGTIVYALYTYIDGEPSLAFEGYYRNMYEWMGDGRFYYFGSGGAIYSTFATYKLDGTDLICEDFYFSHEKDETFEEIGYYHNTSGEWDISVSEEMSEDDFWPVSNAWREEVEEIEWITFASDKN